MDSATSLRSARNDRDSASSLLAWIPRLRFAPRGMTAFALRSVRNDRESVSRMLEWIPSLQGVNGFTSAFFAMSLTPVRRLH
jgi:hypothetical protein